MGEFALQIAARAVLSKSTLGGENGAGLVLQIGTLGGVRIVLVAIAFVLREFWIAGDHLAKAAIAGEALACLLHRLFHFRCFIGRVRAGFAFRIGTKAAMARDMTQHDREFIAGERPFMRGAPQVPGRHFRAGQSARGLRQRVTTGAVQDSILGQ